MTERFDLGQEKFSQQIRLLLDLAQQIHTNPVNGVFRERTDNPFIDGEFLRISRRICADPVNPHALYMCTKSLLTALGEISRQPSDSPLLQNNEVLAFLGRVFILGSLNQKLGIAFTL